jgi:hypothetical protein
MLARARFVSRLACVAALWGLFLRHAVVLAAEPAPQQATTILLIADPDDPTAARVAAEIRASGLTVTSVPSIRTDVDVPGLSRSADAVGAVHIDRGGGEVRIWAVDRSTGQVVLRSIVRLDDDPAVVALRVVEGLRASLNAVDWFTPPKTAPHEVPAGDRTSATSPATAPRFGATAGPAFASGGGEFGGSWEGLVSLYWLPASRWGVEAMGVTPLTSARVLRTAGSATLAFGLIAGGVRARALAAGWCFLDVSAGFGAAAIRTQGFPKPGFSGTKATTWVATPYAGIGYAVSIAPPFWLLADVAGAFAIPRPTFTYAGEAASWGTPILLASVGMEVTFR